MKPNPVLPAMRLMLIVFCIITGLLSSCKKHSADARLSQMENIVSKWEYKLNSRPVSFDDLIYIQSDITAYDVDKKIFEAEYGLLNDEQQKRLMNIRTRFKKLMRKDD